ncbi:SigE family RNA polymerase sigma factor [Nakamurella alba]|uniref:SigE family RNA polymerase sigma factor n=1 Tax=Nakamurella alba TaxID=2665158 RepID=UPI0018AA95C1|nr:SigE family RNA polymerase sigma factor [Nakamurella alba]
MPEFEQFVAERGHGWQRYARALTGNDVAAQDLVQSVLLKAYRQWRRITAMEFPDAYVRRMLTSTFLDGKRRRSDSEVLLAELPEPGPAAPDPAIRVTDRDSLRRALATLSDRQRAVVVLRYLEDLPDAEIAAELGCSEATVRSHAAQGRARFRDALLALDHDRTEESL